jgi:hypothetical protein
MERTIMPILNHDDTYDIAMQSVSLGIATDSLAPSTGDSDQLRQAKERLRAIYLDRQVKIEELKMKRLDFHIDSGLYKLEELANAKRGMLEDTATLREIETRRLV